MIVGLKSAMVWLSLEELKSDDQNPKINLVNRNESNGKDLISISDPVVLRMRDSSN